MLLRDSLTGGEAAAFDAWVREAFRPYEDDLWLLHDPVAIGAPAGAVESGSFVIERAPWNPLDEQDAVEIPELIGYRPAEEITLSALANRTNDHLVLGHLCLTLAHRFGALIDFGGALHPEKRPGGVPSLEPDAGQSERWVAAITIAISALPGTVYEFRYMTARDTVWACHIGDAEFLAAWLAHPRFHMVK